MVPGWTLAVGVGTLTTKVPADPRPVMTADCGDPAALSETEIAAVRVAAVVGVKVTVMVQVAPAASDAPQVLVWLKLLALAPVTEMPVMLSGALPGFDSVMGSVDEVLIVVLEKVSGFGLNAAWGMRGGTPVPVIVAE